jgi:hypothetical protein
MPLRDVSAGRTCSIAADVRGYFDAHRPVAGAARTSVRGAGIEMRQIERQRCALKKTKQRVPAPRGRQPSLRLPAAPIAGVQLVAIDDRINRTVALVRAGIRANVGSTVDG